MFTPEQNQVFDEILKARRSCRKFSERLPDQADVTAVIEAGQLAPYASISSRDVDVFRHFFVLWRGNPMLEQIDTIIRGQTLVNVERLRREMEEDPFLREYGVELERRWGITARNGSPVFPDPPCLIVLAEWRGARRGEKQSLAHTVQNMWLKATALNLDFNIISAIENLTDNQEFCDLFGLPVGRYGFHGCVVGYRAAEHLSSLPVTTQVHWL